MLKLTILVLFSLAALIVSQTTEEPAPTLGEVTSTARPANGKIKRSFSSLKATCFILICSFPEWGFQEGSWADETTEDRHSRLGSAAGGHLQTGASALPQVDPRSGLVSPKTTNVPLLRVHSKVGSNGETQLPVWHCFSQGNRVSYRRWPEIYKGIVDDDESPWLLERFAWPDIWSNKFWLPIFLGWR